MRNRIRRLLNAVTPTIRSIYSAIVDDRRSCRISRNFAELLEPRVLLSSVTLHGGNGDDTFYIRRDAESGDVLVWHNEPNYSNSNADLYDHLDLESFVITGGGGDDIVTLDTIDGNPFRNGAFVFDGGTGNDQLRFSADSAITSRGAYRPNFGDSGSVTVGKKSMNFGDVESLSVSHFNRFRLRPSYAGINLSIDSPTSTINRISGSYSFGGAFSPLTFSNVTSFIVDTDIPIDPEDTMAGELGDDDTLTISGNGMRADGLNVLKVLMGQGNNTLTSNGGVTTLDTGIGVGGAYTNLVLNNDAAVNLWASQYIQSITVNGSSRLRLPSGGFKAVFTESLNIPEGSTSQIDLADNDLVVRNGDIDFIGAQIRRAYGPDAQNHYWQGSGITSSLATPSHTALGFIRPDETASYIGVDGQEIYGTDVVIKFTYVGDNNLDAQVTFSDMLDLMANWNTSGKRWMHGDYNYDGSVTISDFVDQTSNYNAHPRPTFGLLGSQWNPQEGSTLTIPLKATVTGNYTAECYDDDGNPYSCQQHETYDPIQYWTIYWGDGTFDTVPMSSSAADPDTHMVTTEADHIYDDDGSYVIRAFAKGTDVHYYATIGLVSVANVAPTLQLLGSDLSMPGPSVTLSLDSDDAGDDTITSWNLDWGDGTIFYLPGDPIPQHHTYAGGLADAVVTAEAFDEDGGPYMASRILHFVVPAAPHDLGSSSDFGQQSLPCLGRRLR